MIAVIDNAIPYIKGVLEPFVDVVYAPGDAFKAVLDSHPEEEFCLLVRTRTKCGKDLLQGRKVRMIASATIGKDHIDEDYCRANSICVVNAPGCNSAAVMQYVFTSLAYSGILPETVENRRFGVIPFAHNREEEWNFLCRNGAIKMKSRDVNKCFMKLYESQESYNRKEIQQ